MRVLAIDTSTEALSIALCTERGTIERGLEMARGHAEQILPLIDAVLVEADVRLSQLDGIAAGVGPGTFTGVRISVAVAQGLAYGAGLPVVPVTSLEALAFPAIEGGAELVIACLDARMGEVYWGCFARDPAQGLRALGSLQVSPASRVHLPDAGRYRGVGRGFTAYPELAALAGIVSDARSAAALPNAADIARLGALRFAAGQGVDPAELKPEYVRDKVALTEAERRAAMGRSANDRPAKRRPVKRRPVK
jgi:tRNA threonylcarbamoyladenosine biosynthesis protein TsaB